MIRVNKINLVDVSMYLGPILLKEVLMDEDNCLGPCEMDSGSLEEKLRGMTGVKGAPHYTSWEEGMGVWGVETIVGKYRDNIRIDDVPLAFPQYTSLMVSLIKSQMKLLGRLLSHVNTKCKLQILNVIF